MLCYITLYSLSNLLPKHSSFSSQTSNYNKRLRLAKESLVNLTGEGATGIELFALQIFLKIRVLKKNWTTESFTKCLLWVGGHTYESIFNKTPEYI